MEEMSKTTLTRSEIKRIILEELPRLIKKDPEIREFILWISSERFADKKRTEDRIERILDELRRDREENTKRWEENQRRFERMQEEWNQRWEENQRRFERMQAEWNQRWEENQKRIERMQAEWNQRWEENQRRFERMQEEWNQRWEENQRRFERMQAEWNQKWEENQKRIEIMQAEWNQRWEENQRRFERMQAEWNQKWEENQKRIERMQAEWNQRWEENQKTIRTMLEKITQVERKYDTGIGAIGARWGLRAESSFRDAMKGILEESFPVKVERYKGWDEEGMVFGRPDQVELDLIVKDGLLVVAEIKSSISKGDVLVFLRKLKFYESKEGKKVDRKIIISPMVESSALQFAKDMGLEVYGYPEEVDLEKLQ